YTLDGSCPCDAQNANVMTYTGPITATGEELTIRAMAVANGMAESDVVKFRYKVIDNPVSVEPILLSPFTLHPSPTEYYRLDGHRTPTLQKGLNIVRQKDGTVRKVTTK
ncbi:MAG: chitobiase/beta-hexosaminidase C-terminal domain-containing protein, partial [Prevotella sp.]|nr:chitobiase/beta-hexosaminidase C-terminal domain-containing protein [Prevotella sp.]